MQKIKINIKKFAVILLFFFLCVVIVNSVKLEDSVHVFENDDLVYYINVYYDGKDVYGVESSDSNSAEISSGYISVEDKLPDGLIFDGFVTNETDGIGAVNRADGTGCPGYVVGGVNGLIYNETTHTVSFQVRNLQAGCMLTVGIKTKTPVLEEGVDRMDFYNTVTASEGLIIKTSNTVHAWIGKESTENLQKYKVTYIFDGEVPENSTIVPIEKQYIEGATVKIDSNAVAPGYIFSGWAVQSGDVVIENNSFNMPANDVVLVGSFTKDSTYVPYKVTYQITSTDNPSGYIAPKEKEYYANENVKLDKLTAGTVYNDYRFSGWTVVNSSITIDDNMFVMPNSDVVFVGSWEPVTYKVEYQFMGAIIPPNSENLLPETKYYRPGAPVTLEDISDVGDYEFLGWYHSNSFNMPTNDVIIYGEWKNKPNYFRPIISKKIVDKQEYFSFGDIVTYEITVTAPTDVDLTDIYVKENNEKAKFIEGTGYTIMTNSIVKIDSLAAGNSIVLTAQYVASPDDNGTVVNEVEIIGALAGNNYEIDRNVEYKATDTFNIDSSLKVCNIVNGAHDNRTFQYHITGTNYDSWIVLKDDECKTLYLEPGTYNVYEVVPQDYNLISVVGSITDNNTSFNVGLGKEYGILFTNDYDKKGFYHTAGRIENIIRYVRDLNVDNEEENPA